LPEAIIFLMTALMSVMGLAPLSSVVSGATAFRAVAAFANSYTLTAGGGPFSSKSNRNPTLG
jgi:hypothetical protein